MVLKDRNRHFVFKYTASFESVGNRCNRNNLVISSGHYCTLRQLQALLFIYGGTFVHFEVLFVATVLSSETHLQQFIFCGTIYASAFFTMLVDSAEIVARLLFSAQFPFHWIVFMGDLLPPSLCTFDKLHIIYIQFLIYNNLSGEKLIARSIYSLKPQMVD